MGAAPAKVTLTARFTIAILLQELGAAARRVWVVALPVPSPVFASAQLPARRELRRVGLGAEARRRVLRVTVGLARPVAVRRPPVPVSDRFRATF